MLIMKCIMVSEIKTLSRISFTFGRVFGLHLGRVWVDGSCCELFPDGCGEPS